MTAALEIRDVTVRFGGITALNRVGLRLGAGGVHALIGPNGAGKTTLVSLLSGERRPDEGQVLLNGRDLNGLDTARRARLGMTRTYQLTALFQKMTVRENLLMSLVARDRPALALADLWRTRDHDRYADEVAGLVERFALDPAVQPAALSHGDRRRLEIAMALASGPKVLLLDEPLAGLSTADAQALVGMIGSTIRGHVPILLIEHDMDAVFVLADEITVMVNGTVLESGLPEQIRASAQVQAAYLSEKDDF